MSHYQLCLRSGIFEYRTTATDIDKADRQTADRYCNADTQTDHTERERERERERENDIRVSMQTD
jgi:hypothetical protein